MAPLKNRQLYYVRSAYHVELQARRGVTASSSSGGDKDIWNKLWQANIPHKIRHFGWRAIHNGLPVCENLFKRKIGGDRMCPLCGESKETVTHALILCPEIKWMWNISPLRLEVKEQGEFYFANWCTNRAKVVKAGEWWDIFWVLLWGVWLRRNAWVFESKVIKVEEVVSRAMKLVGEYQPQEEPKMLTERVEPIQPSRWKPSGFGLYKINSDAAVFEEWQGWARRGNA